MFVVFKKEFRQFELVLSDLRKKMKQSEKFEKTSPETGKNLEGYKLDTVDIIFDVVCNVLIVKNKQGEQIVSINCNFDVNDILQNAKFYHFSDLLDFARKIYSERVLNPQVKAKSDAGLKRKAVAESQKRKKMFADTLNNLRNLTR